jgi:hypothetical protein
MSPFAVPSLRAAACALLLFFAAAPAASQTTSVVGRVVDAFSMAPVAGASVQGGGTKAVTDADGRFQLALTPGRVRLAISADGYLADQVEVVVGGLEVKIEVLLIRREQFKEDVVVTAGAPPAGGLSPAVVGVSPLQVRTVAGAAENVFKVLQTLPGVNATADFDSRLSVRGGGPDQNLTVMDGVEIHDPYRLFGLTSAFNPETVDRFELTAGGFSAKYGDRLSSILVIDNRAGTDAKRLAGSASLALTDANVVLEGALPVSMKGSWLFSARRTYYDLVADRITGQNLPSFGDLQAKGVWQLRPGRRLTVFALRSRESTDATFSESASQTSIGLKNTARNDLFSVSLASTLGARVSSKTIVSWYRYGDGLSADGTAQDQSARSNAPGDSAYAISNIGFSRDVTVRDLSVREELGIRAASRHFVEAGFDAHALATSWGWNITGDRNTSEANGSSARGGVSLPALLDSQQDDGRAGAWVIDHVQLSPRAILEPALRLDWSGLAHETILSPRVAGMFDLGRGVRLRAAAGLFTQSPGYEKLLQSDYFVDLTSAQSGQLRSERSTQALAALEREFAPGLTVRVEGYYKSFSRLLVGRLETPEETAARVALYDFPPELASSVPAQPQITSTPSNGATGSAYGFDIYIAHRPSSSADRLSGWASYTWGRADIDAYGRRHPFDYDRRHALSLVGSYRVSRLIELSATVRVAAGFPYTPARGLRVAAVGVTDASGVLVSYVPQRDANGLYVWTTDLGGVDNLNTVRLPVFARVDLRATFRPSWMNDRWQLYVEVINVLNRKNAGNLDAVLEYDPASDRPRLTYTPGASLPLLPSVGVRVRF